jgi:hypothetical protein
MCLLTQGMGLMIRVAASTVKSHAWWGCVFAVLDRCKYVPCHPLPSHTRCSSYPAVRNPPAQPSCTRATFRAVCTCGPL